MYDSNTIKSRKEFLYFYHYFKFAPANADKIAEARAKRTQLILNALECNKSGDRAASGFLVEDNLEEYCEIIDNRNGINNYAHYINILYGKLQSPVTECHKWKSNIQNLKNATRVVEDYNLNVKSVEEKRVDDFSQFEIECVKKKIYHDETKNERTRVTNIQKDFYKEPSFMQNSEFKPRTSSVSSQLFQDPKNRDVVFGTSTGISNQAKKKEISVNSFRTARTELKIQTSKNYDGRDTEIVTSNESFGVKRSLGARSRTVSSKFIPPMKNNGSPEEHRNNPHSTDESQIEDERLKNLDPKMIELIKNEIMDHGNPITWDDISGLDFAKKTIQEIIVWPLLRPDIFTGLRRPPKGILLFGPPGTGKTLIGKCIASQSSSTFFSISASSLTSKWIGESEKLVRTLFAVARCHQPAVIFIDEIDSLLSQRNETEHESSRRIKTEFLVQLDGATTHEDDRILVVGATNRPQELDEAARRRLVKRLYIPLPEFQARCQIIQRLMSNEKNDLTDENVEEIARLADGYSGADMKNLCQEASLGPIRSIDFRLISSIESQQVRPVTLSDFKAALKAVRSSVSSTDLNHYLEWDKMYGSRGT